MWSIVKHEPWLTGHGYSTEPLAQPSTMPQVRLPTTLVARYRAVDREEIWAPPEVVDTPAHLDALTRDIRENGILVPLELRFNESFATLDGNHRIAVALRLGLSEVPVELSRLPVEPRQFWAQTMAHEDYELLVAALPPPEDHRR